MIRKEMRLHGSIKTVFEMAWFDKDMYSRWCGLITICIPLRSCILLISMRNLLNAYLSIQSYSNAPQKIHRRLLILLQIQIIDSPSHIRAHYGGVPNLRLSHQTPRARLGEGKVEVS